MSLQLDTHVAIWAAAESQRLGRATRDRVCAEPGGLYVSVASIWEIAIKWSLTRGESRVAFNVADAVRHFSAAGYSPLDIRADHVVCVESLQPLHADPCDQLLLAQTRGEGITLLTADEKLLQFGYGVMSV